MKDFLSRHKSLTAIWAVVLVIGAYAGYTLFFKSSGNENPYVLSNSSSRADTQEEAAGSAEEGARRINKGEAAQDDDMEFTVNSISDCSETTIGTNQYAMDQAQGRFCRLNVTVKNVGSAPASLPAVQRLALTSGEEFKLDSQATPYAQEDQTAGPWYEDIAAGETVTGDLVFDISDGQVAKAFLHGAEGTPGIEVNLQ